MNKKRPLYKKLYYECKNEKEILDHQVNACKLMLENLFKSLHTPQDYQGYKFSLLSKAQSACWHASNNNYVCDMIKELILNYEIKKK